MSCYLRTFETCTYHLPEVFLETDQVTLEEADFIRNCIYRQELLNFFDLEEFDECFLESKIRELYIVMVLEEEKGEKEEQKEENKKEKVFELFLDILQKNFSFFSQEQCFSLLFSFDFFWITQLCLKDYFETGIISQPICTKLLEKLKNYSQ
jgi:hypothetical protein